MHIQYIHTIGDKSLVVKKRTRRVQERCKYKDIKAGP